MIFWRCWRVKGRLGECALGLDLVCRSAECGLECASGKEERSGVGWRRLSWFGRSETGATLASTSSRELAERSSLKHVYRDDHLRVSFARFVPSRRRATRICLTTTITKVHQVHPIFIRPRFRPHRIRITNILTRHRLFLSPPSRLR
jgi:hypothetical protein